MNKNNFDAYTNMQNVLDKHTDIQLVYVFGSTARATAKTEIDIAYSAAKK